MPETQYREWDIPATWAIMMNMMGYEDSNGEIKPVSSTNPLPITSSGSTGNATATLSDVASSATSVTLLAANADRKWATIQNDSTQTLYVKFGTTASSSSYTVLMVASSYYEVPFSYTGRIDGIWASANGNARITEITA